MLVSKRLEEKILSSVFNEGDRLPPERQLMEEFGVSRTAIREAIAELAGKGLLETKPRHRPIIRRQNYGNSMESFLSTLDNLLTDDGGLKSLYESRVFFESALVRHAALKAKKQDIDELRAALQENKNAIGQTELFHATDIAFHRVLYGIPGNPLYPMIHNTFVSWLTGNWRRQERGADINRVMYAGHEAIFEAIVDRDPDGAERALERHLQIAWDYVRSVMLHSAD